MRGGKCPRSWAILLSMSSPRDNTSKSAARRWPHFCPLPTAHSKPNCMAARSAQRAVRGNQMHRSGQRHRSIPTLIVDKSALFRAGLIHILAGTRFRVMAGCPTLKDIQKSAWDSHGCLALISLDEGARAVLSEVSFLRAQHEDLHFVVFSDRFDLEELLIAVASGVDCYLLKNEISSDALLQSLELVFFEETIVLQGFAQRLRRQMAPEKQVLSLSDYLATYSQYSRSQDPVEPPQAADYVVQLSTKEQLTLLHLTQGASNKQIARELNIAEATVKTHVKALLHKIGVRNRTQAAVWAINHPGQSHLDAVKPLKRSTGLPVLLDRLGGLGLDVVDQSAVARSAEPDVHAVTPNPPPANGRGSSL